MSVHPRIPINMLMPWGFSYVGTSGNQLGQGQTELFSLSALVCSDSSASLVNRLSVLFPTLREVERPWELLVGVVEE